jgi:hypothetical protein
MVQKPVQKRYALPAYAESWRGQMMQMLVDWPHRCGIESENHEATTPRLIRFGSAKQTGNCRNRGVGAGRGRTGIKRL